MRRGNPEHPSDSPAGSFLRAAIVDNCVTVICRCGNYYSFNYTDEGNIDKFEIFDYNYSVEISPHYDNPGHSESFGYNSEGIRVYKEYEEEPGYTVRHEYTVSGSRIIKETVYYDGAEIFTLVFSCDENGSPIGYRFRRPNYPENVYDCYYYDKNLQGDIVGVYGSSGNLLVSYVYDAWGSCYPEYTNEGNDEYWDNPGEYFNPFRYRGYYYDEETGLYYVSYDPEVGRFISPDTTDVLTITPMALTDKNLYAYCDNNPVNRTDDGGMFWDNETNKLMELSQT